MPVSHCTPSPLFDPPSPGFCPASSSRGLLVEKALGALARQDVAGATDVVGRVVGGPTSTSAWTWRFEIAC